MTQVGLNIALQAVINSHINAIANLKRLYRRSLNCLSESSRVMLPSLAGSEILKIGGDHINIKIVQLCWLIMPTHYLIDLEICDVNRYTH